MLTISFVLCVIAAWIDYTSALPLPGSASLQTVSVTSTSPDTTAPQVSYFSAQVVDDNSLRINVTASDSGGSGWGGYFVRLSSVSYTTEFSASAADSCSQAGRELYSTCPTKFGGSYSDGQKLSVPYTYSYIPSGVYSLSVMVFDRVGNERTYSSQDLQSAGRDFSVTLTTSFTVDTSPPALTGFAETPRTYNGMIPGAKWTVEMNVTNLSTYWAYTLLYLPPSGYVQVADTAPNGFYTVGTVPQSTTGVSVIPPSQNGLIRAGTWKPFVLLYDINGPSRSYSPQDLADLGFPNGVTVSSNVGDSDPPVCTEARLWVDATSTDAADIDVRVNITCSDAGTGMAVTSLFFVKNTVTGYYYKLFSNTVPYQNANFKLPRYTPATSLQLTGVIVLDAARNVALYGKCSPEYKRDVFDSGWKNVPNLDFCTYDDDGNSSTGGNGNNNGNNGTGHNAAVAASGSSSSSVLLALTAVLLLVKNLA